MNPFYVKIGWIFRNPVFGIAQENIFGLANFRGK